MSQFDSKRPDAKYESFPELTSIAMMRPFARAVTSPRAVMRYGMDAQRIVLQESDFPRLCSGDEYVRGLMTWDVRIEHNAHIIAVIKRYDRILPDHLVPETLVVYEDIDRPGSVHVAVLDRFHSLHQSYGFEFKETEAMANLRRGCTRFEKGTRLLSSPNLQDNGKYATGLELMVCEGNFPATIEDGFMVADDVYDRMSPTMVKSYTVACDDRQFPTNLHGEVGGVYKVVPDIGESVPSHRILCNLRRLGSIWDQVAEMSAEDVCNVSHDFDRKTYVAEDGMITDIRVVCNTGLTIPPLPVGMDCQLTRYLEEENHFHRRILDLWCVLGKKYGTRLELSPELHRYIVRAGDRVGSNYQPPVGHRCPGTFNCAGVARVHDGNPIAHWSIEVTVVARPKVSLGAKLTDQFASKGVAVVRVPRADMPMLDNGVSADICLFDASSHNRTNPGRRMEQYINSITCALTDRCRRMAGVYDAPDYRTRVAPERFAETIKVGGELTTEIAGLLMRYYEMATPVIFREMIGLPGINDSVLQYHHVMSVLTDGGYLCFDSNTPVSLPEHFENLRREFQPMKGHFTYTNVKGERVQGVSKMLFGTMSFDVLEKLAADWSAVATAKLSPFGTPSRLGKHDKDNAAGKQQSVRIFGETDIRALIAILGPKTVTQYLQIHNNPLINKEVLRQILKTDKPMLIADLFAGDMPPAGHRMLDMLHHIYSIHGVAIEQRVVQK